MVALLDRTGRAVPLLDLASGGPTMQSLATVKGKPSHFWDLGSLVGGFLVGLVANAGEGLCLSRVVLT